MGFLANLENSHSRQARLDQMAISEEECLHVMNDLRSYHVVELAACFCQNPHVSKLRFTGFSEIILLVIIWNA